MTCLLSSYCTKADGCTAHIGVDIERCSAFEKRPQTNFEYLQTCSFEELAEEIEAWWFDGADSHDSYGIMHKEREEAKAMIMKWLQEKHQ